MLYIAVTNDLLILLLKLLVWIHTNMMK